MANTAVLSLLGIRELHWKSDKAIGSGFESAGVVYELVTRKPTISTSSSGPDPDAWVFTGEKGGPLRPHVLGKAFWQARLAAERPTLTLHDLRHSADTLAAATGASLPELMNRMGHATPNSALRYLHATKDRDKVFAEALAELRPIAPVVPITRVSGED